MRSSFPTPPAKTWTVALEGGKMLRVTESTVLDQGLFAGLELDEAALDALRSAAASTALRSQGGRSTLCAGHVRRTAQ
ncbi:MAG: hypothetical protein ACLUNZ_04175 [Evtepia sp.]